MSENITFPNASINRFNHSGDCDQCLKMRVTPEQITSNWCFGKPFCMFNIDEQLENEITKCKECDHDYCDRKCKNELYFAYRIVIE